MYLSSFCLKMIFTGILTWFKKRFVYQTLRYIIAVVDLREPILHSY